MSFSKKSAMIWNDLHRCIGHHGSFLISSHLSLDGDCVGSERAFAWYLISLGKKAAVFNHDPVPAKFGFLRNAGLIRTEKPPAGDFEALVVLDCSNLRRLGWDTATAGYDALPSINIDHHRDNTLFGKVNIVDTHASATGELLYRFFTGERIAFPPEVAEALYAAILFDTWGFRLPNTGNETLLVAAEILALGAQRRRLFLVAERLGEARRLMQPVHPVGINVIRITVAR
jgi:phosphoesterase RecJ-like protein